MNKIIVSNQTEIETSEKISSIVIDACKGNIVAKFGESNGMLYPGGGNYGGGGGGGNYAGGSKFDLTVMYSSNS